jgi:hypothetical protein
MQKKSGAVLGHPLLSGGGVSRNEGKVCRDSAEARRAGGRRGLRGFLELAVRAHHEGEAGA